MKKLYFIGLFFIGFLAHAQKEKVLQNLDQKADFYGAIAKEIWSNPELGYLENKSSALLQKTLADAGFSVKADVAGIPTSFVTEYGLSK